MAGVGKALMQLSGIGRVGAWVLASEIFGWRQFRNRREVGAVLGLTPTPYSSGRDERELGAEPVVHDPIQRGRQTPAAVTRSLWRYVDQGLIPAGAQLKMAQA